jgi:hypothetical protein
MAALDVVDDDVVAGGVGTDAVHGSGLTRFPETKKARPVVAPAGPSFREETPKEGGGNMGGSMHRAIYGDGIKSPGTMAGLCVISVSDGAIF